MMVDYSEIVTIVAEVVRVALPIGIIFALAERACNMFIGMVTGEKRVKM